MGRSIRRLSGLALLAWPVLGLSADCQAAGPFGEANGRVSVFAPAPPSTQGAVRIGPSAPALPVPPPAPAIDGQPSEVDLVPAPGHEAHSHAAEPAHAHAEHHHHHHHAHHEHHEEEEHEEAGRLTVMPHVRLHGSDLWDDTFDPMYGVNVGTIFWREPECWFGRPVRCGLVLEFGYGVMSAKDDVTLVQPARRPAPAEFDIVGQPNLVGPNFYTVEEANLYTGNIGVAFETLRPMGDSGMAMETGFAPVLLIGSLNSDFNAQVGPDADDQIIFINQERERDSGTYIGADFRLWMNLVTENGTRLGVYGFGGVADCEAIFSNSEDFNSYGGGLYVDMPTNWIPHKLPKISGATQWFDWLLEEI